MLGDDRRRQLAMALEAGFPDGPSGLREIASSYVTDGLARNLPENASLASLVHTIASATTSVFESVLRTVRRRRPGRTALALAIADTWPFADGLDFACTDRLLVALDEAEIPSEDLRKAAKSVVGAELPPLWSIRGPEPHGDLIEGLAQLPGRPLTLVLVAERLRARPEVARWLDELSAHAPREAIPAFTCGQRMLLVLRRGVKNHYKGDIYFADAGGEPRFVAALRRQAPLADIAAVFSETRRQKEDLRGALLDADLELIEVMLPVRDLLTRVEQWDLVGSGPIGRLFPVVVRPLERAFAMQYDDYIGGAMLLRSSWKALKRAPAMRRIELEPEQVESAVLQHPQHWCVAVLRCPDPVRADRVLEIDRLVKGGVAAMLTVRHEHTWPEVASACSLPAAVHLHRRDPSGQPMMLLWDDADFNPGSKK
jgi:hypothetical protein